jgi:hypothetical protein
MLVCLQPLLAFLREEEVHPHVVHAAAVLDLDPVAGAKRDMDDREGRKSNLSNAPREFFNGLLRQAVESQRTG